MAGAIAPTFSRYLDDLIGARRAQLEAGDPSTPNDVLTRLLELAGVAQAGSSDPAGTVGALDLLGIRRNLAGFALGSVVASSVAIVSAVQYLLQPANADALAVTVAAAKADDRAQVGACMLEAARLGAPSPPSVFRTATTDYVLARGTPRETTIPAGSVVALYPVVAMTDPEQIDDPFAFRPGRPPSNYLMFGDGLHRCFGTAIGEMFLRSVGCALFALDGLREDAPLQSADGVPACYYPGTYRLSVSPPAPPA